MKKKHSRVWIIILCVLTVLAAIIAVFARLGGFTTGECANVEELAACAGAVEDIAIPENVKIVALGEASHGNAEFQQLKLDVFKVLAENCGVRAFCLEGDYGGCEQVNRYIHGGEGTAQEAAAAIGFAIYRTDEMAQLIEWMREYNDIAAEGEDLRFYGFDMQRCAYSLSFLVEACKSLDVDAAKLEKLIDGEDWSGEFEPAARTELLTDIKAQLEGMEDCAREVHLADVLLQNIELGMGESAQYADLRDSYMAENVQWILRQEQQLGRERIFVSAHNGHVAKFASNNTMGQFLAESFGEDYFVIGTDFYKTSCNMPKADYSGRTVQTFYSHDPLAKAAHKAGFDVCWLDFSAVPEDSELAGSVNGYTYMGSLGEGYGWYMHLLPPSYRIFQPPSELYDGMIFVSNAQPTVIVDAK